MSAPSLKKLTLTIAMTLALSACGGGGGDNSTANSSNTANNSNNTSSGSNTSTQPTTPTTNGLAQAKELINTAKQFIVDMEAVQTVYEDASDIITNTQRQRLSDSIDIMQAAYAYMSENNKTRLSLAELKAVLDDEAQNNWDYHTITLADTGTLSLSLDSTGKLTANGSATLIRSTKQFVNWDSATNSPVFKIISTDTTPVVYTNYVDGLTNNQAAKNVPISFSIEKLEIGSGNDKLTLTAKDSGNAVGEFNKTVVLNDEFDFDTSYIEQGVKLEKATLRFNNVSLVTNASTITVNTLETSLVGIYRDINQVTTTQQYVSDFIPYQLKLVGKLVRNNPATNLNITLNATADQAAVKNSFVFSGDYEIKETQTIPVNATLSLQGVVTKATGTTIPINLQAQLERAANKLVSLKNASAVINNKALSITGNATFNTTNDHTGTTFTISQGTAKTSLQLDAQGDTKTSNTGKVSDITVNGVDYGDLYYDGSRWYAKFTDNAFIYL
ncbi:MAG: hypothetical protein Q4C68_00645 [Moraxella sp.]|nr:hypothetical protein [Moraxella sp.]